MSSFYTNHVEVSISDVVRLSFYEIVNGERIIVTQLVMGIELLDGFSKTAAKTIEDYKKAISR